VAKSRKQSEEYRSILNSLAESVMNMTDKDILEEYGAAATDRTKEILRSAAKAHAQGKLRAAKLRHEQVSGQIQSHSFELPPTASARRELLNAVLASQFARGLDELTAQFRELASVPDSDVESTLRQLDLLGVLRKFRETSR
jgi:hypothetical protein